MFLESKWLAPLSILLASALPASGADLLFGVNEGTSSSAGALQRQDKYADLSVYLTRALGKTVRT